MNISFRPENYHIPKFVVQKWVRPKNGVIVVPGTPGNAKLGLSWDNEFHWFDFALEGYNFAVAPSGRILFQNATGFYSILPPTSAEIKLAIIDKPSLQDSGFKIQAISNIAVKSTDKIGAVPNCMEHAESDTFYIQQNNELYTVLLRNDQEPIVGNISNLIENEIDDITSNHLSEIFVKTKVIDLYFRWT